MSPPLSVLYVDDERNNRLVFQHVLGRTLAVRVAESGEAALAILAEAPVEVLLADHRMPGMSGLELARAVRQRHPNVVRVVITAYPYDEALTRAVDEGLIETFLTKPWDPDALARTLIRIAGGSRFA